jgi:hypothetical protein
VRQSHRRTTGWLALPLLALARPVGGGHRAWSSATTGVPSTLFHVVRGFLEETALVLAVVGSTGVSSSPAGRAFGPDYGRPRLRRAQRLLRFGEARPRPAARRAVTGRVTSATVEPVRLRLRALRATGTGRGRVTTAQSVVAGGQQSPPPERSSCGSCHRPAPRDRCRHRVGPPVVERSDVEDQPVPERAVHQVDSSGGVVARYLSSGHGPFQ